MPNKTIEQYQQEIVQLRNAMQQPGVPDGEKQIYADTIQKIEGIIIAAQRAVPKQSSQPSPQPPLRAISHSSPLGDGPEAGVKHAGNPTKNTPSNGRNGSPTSNTAVISAILSGSTKQVIIQWGHGKSDTLTEGEARSRFTTALRDLAQSRMANLGRFDDLSRYITFGRAVAYYRALTEFWITAPTPAQLSIYPLSRTRQTIFDMITQAACAAQTHP